MIQEENEISWTETELFDQKKWERRCERVSDFCDKYPNLPIWVVWDTEHSEEHVVISYTSKERVKNIVTTKNQRVEEMTIRDLATCEISTINDFSMEKYIEFHN